MSKKLKKKLESEIQKLTEELGFKLNLEPQGSLEQFSKGRPLTFGELRQLPNGSVVWIYIFYKKSVRADSAFHLEKDEFGWFFDDGSFGGADLTDKGKDEELARDEYLEVFEAIPLT